MSPIDVKPINTLLKRCAHKPSKAYLIKASILTTLVVIALGCIDFLTGEISIDVLFILCICLVTWYTNTFLGLLCVGEIAIAKMSADYCDKIKIGSHLYEWNMLNNIFIYLIVCFLVRKIKKSLSA